MWERPNIVMLYTDQQRGDALGADGNEHIRTPVLDSLARSGARFRRHFVQHPLCMPSRISMLSGQYPSTLGITDMGVPVPTSWVLLPHLLAAAGYRCINIGKLHFLPHSNRDHRRPHPSYGFDHVEISDEPGVYPDAYTAWLSNVAPGVVDHLPVGLPPAAAAWRATLGIGGQDVSGAGRDDYSRVDPWPHADGLTHTAFVAERTIAAINTAPQDQPIFCIAGFFSPHAPYHVPARYLDLYARADLPLPEYPPEVEAARRDDERFGDDHLRMVKHGYYAAVGEVDHHVGRILGALEASGRRDRTVVVMTSDHGEWLGDHLRYAKGPPGDDSVTRVPLLVSGPGIEPGTVVDDIVEAVDIAPTLCSFAGVQAPPWMQGESLRDLCDGSGSRRYRQHARTESTGSWSLRTDRWRYTMRADGSEGLWNIVDDPGEYCDLAPSATAIDAAPVVAELRRVLIEELRVSQRPRARSAPY